MDTDFEKRLERALFITEDIRDCLHCEDKEEIRDGLERLNEWLKRINTLRDATMEQLLESSETLDAVQTWGRSSKEKIEPLKTLRNQLNERLELFKTEELKKRHDNEVQGMMEKFKLEEQFLMRSKEIRNEQNKSTQPKPQAVKLQKYTITPFYGEYTDWTRFWNQYTIEVDGSSIAEISKFNYLLELVKGKPRDDILGLPHTEEGYNEAKAILQENYGKDIKVQRAIINDIQSLPRITELRRTKEIREFSSKLSRSVRVLVNMKKLEGAQCLIYMLFEKLGPVKNIIAQQDDDWENWDLEQLVKHLKKYVDRLPTEDDSRDKRQHHQESRDIKDETGLDNVTINDMTRCCCNNHNAQNVFTATVKTIQLTNAQSSWILLLEEIFCWRRNFASIVHHRVI